jgi:protoporphyrinogen oxidase
LQIQNKSRKQALIVGAGPAGLTAAFELLTRTDIVPTILESSTEIGGLSLTVNYKGNRIDVGGHRFFSKSQRVMDWWLDMLSLQSVPESATRIKYRGQVATVSRAGASTDPESKDRIFLVRDRKSRIYFKGQLFAYPISFDASSFQKLGWLKAVRLGLSYIHTRVYPIRNEKNLEQFLINRFGRDLYATFFKAYTEKVWGVPCSEISAEWGAQRIKGLSLKKVVVHSLRQVCGQSLPANVAQRDVETSLIERFLYPKFGPGQMWEEVARRVRAMGGKILMPWRVDRLDHAGSQRIAAVRATNPESGESRRFEAEFVFSTMPVKELVSAMNPAAPPAIREVAEGLIYRDFITVGVLCKRLALRERSGGAIMDNWIYIQEPGVRVGRLQIFNNWSPWMVADPSTTWIGLEYFCNETDALWRNSDSKILELARDELRAMKIVDPEDVLDAVVIRVPKAYPAYFGTYGRFSEVSSWTDRFENLFLLGRNGMHKYNNQDHSMLTAMVAVDNIIGHISSRANLWALNTEQEYQEEKRPPVPSVA